MVAKQLVQQRQPPDSAAALGDAPIAAAAAAQRGAQQQGLARRLLALAAAVRGAYLLLILAVGWLIADYDTSGSLLSESCGDDWPAAAAAAAQRRPAYVPGVVWDAVFLHRIAACGYEYEQFFAFFPGLPGLVRAVRSAGLLPGPWGFSIVVLAVNNAAFLVSVLLLTRLSQHFLQDDRLAATAVVLFAVTPASIHHSLLYTEALFTLTSWGGLYCLYCCQHASLAAAAAFAASAAVRSNGLLNAGFLMHEHGRRLLQAILDRRWGAAARQAVVGTVCVTIAVAPYFLWMAFGYRQFCTGVYGGGDDSSLGSSTTSTTSTSSSQSSSVSWLSSSLPSFLQRGLRQLSGMHHQQQQQHQQQQHHAQRPWCFKALPSAYGYVQDAYWNVGFLRYYELCQAPNFLIAAPTLIPSLWGAAAYAAASPHSLLTGGLLPPQLLQRWFGRACAAGSSSSSRLRALLAVGAQAAAASDGCGGGGDGSAAAAAATELPAAPRKIPGVAYQQLRRRPAAAGREAADQQQQQQPPGGASLARTLSSSSLASSASSDSPGDGPAGCACTARRGFYGPSVAVFVVHWAALTLVALAVVHIQVATRFLSSCAPLYWFWALLVLHGHRWLGTALWLYCFGFMAVGAVMFTNFLPWT